MLKFKNYKLLFLLIIVLISCKKENLKIYDISTYSINELKINEFGEKYNSIVKVFQLKDVFIIKDSLLLTKHKNDVKFFEIINLKNGDISSTYGKRGNGPDEFSSYLQIGTSFYNNVNEELYLISIALSENKIYKIDSTLNWNLVESVNMMHPLQTMPLNSFVPINNNESYFSFDNNTAKDIYLISYYNSNDKSTLNYFRIGDISDINKLSWPEYITSPRINYKTQMIVLFTPFSKNRLVRTIDHSKKTSNSVVITENNLPEDQATFHVYDAFVNDNEIVLLANFQEFVVSPRTYTYIVKMNYDLDIKSVYKTNEVVSRILKYKDKYLVLYVEDDFIGNDDFDIDNETYKIGTVDLK